MTVSRWFLGLILVAPLVTLRFTLSKRRRSVEAANDSKDRLTSTRRSAKSQKLSHSHDPLVVVRGDGSYLLDDTGTRYLDSRNNVASIGHQHPRWVKAVCDQVALTNTNARYLHPSRNQLAEELCSTLPEQLSVCFFLNSGSEATELALRLARAYTGRKSVLAARMGYHGVTNAALDASPYKWERRPLPDTLHVIEVGGDINEITNKSPIGTFIIESALSVGGVVFPPSGWLMKTMDVIRCQGGVTICDEIQVGLGRMGTHFWGFQQHPEISPDIVTIGKGIGNGFPIAVVVCRQEIADALDAESREVFSTFGGNPVACQAALAVLRVIKDEGLQQNALETGDYLMHELKALRSNMIKEVRGSGLFVGVEFVSGSIASQVTRRLYDIHHVLASLDGPEDKVMVIKPPLCWKAQQVDEFVAALRETLSCLLHRQ